MKWGGYGTQVEGREWNSLREEKERKRGEARQNLGRREEEEISLGALTTRVQYSHPYRAWITRAPPLPPHTSHIPSLLIHGHRRDAQRPYIGLLPSVLSSGSVGSRNPNLKVKFPRGNGRCRVPLSLSLSLALVVLRSPQSDHFGPSLLVSSFPLHTLSCTPHPAFPIRSRVAIKLITSSGM